MFRNPTQSGVPQDGDSQGSNLLVINPAGETEVPVTEAAIETEAVVTLTPGQKRFYASTQCETARQALEDILGNPQYDTESSYFSSNDLGFIDRHLHHLSTHPSTNVTGYISNLKLMTNTKRRD